MSDLARIHYVIPDDLHRQVKAAAALRGRTLKQFVVEALRPPSPTSRPSRRPRTNADRLPAPGAAIGRRADIAAWAAKH